MTTEPLAEFMIRRAALIESVTPGTAATRTLSDLTDEAVSALAEAAFASFDAPWSLLALGAYGSRRLLPFSDLDLLVVVGSDPRSARDCVQALMYPLWDANFEVGHAVRTRKDHIRACAEDVETLTATLTGRHLAGDEKLAAETVAAVAKYAGKKRTVGIGVLTYQQAYDLGAAGPQLRGSGVAQDMRMLGHHFRAIEWK